MRPHLNSRSRKHTRVISVEAGGRGRASACGCSCRARSQVRKKQADCTDDTARRGGARGAQSKFWSSTTQPRNGNHGHHHHHHHHEQVADARSLPSSVQYVTTQGRWALVGAGTELDAYTDRVRAWCTLEDGVSCGLYAELGSNTSQCDRRETISISHLKELGQVSGFQVRRSGLRVISQAGHISGL
eukprot:3313591-Pleurochrysis_carterae.AAC.1